jgi:hypothetical protein
MSELFWTSEVLGQLEILRFEPTLRLGRDQRDRAQATPGNDKRHDDDGGEADLMHDAEVLFVAGGSREHLFGDLGVELSAAGSEHVGYAHGGFRIRRVASLQLVRPRDFRRVLVGNREPFYRALLTDYIDGAPVRQGRHRQSRDV